MKLVIVTSPATDAGKTFLATGLTEIAAHNKYRTIYVDLDKPVGDSLRVFGLRHQSDIPTITTYHNYSIDDYARTPAGGYILPKPDNINEKFSVENAESLITSLKKDFDVAIIDLGASLESPFWKSFVEQADLTLLVTDCDDKALYRIQELLTKVYAKPPKGYTLLINNREGKQSFYTPHQIYRTLSSYKEITNTFKVPYFKNLEKKNPKTFSPKEKFAQDLLRLILSSQSEKDFKLLADYIPIEDAKDSTPIKAPIVEEVQQPMQNTFTDTVIEDKDEIISEEEPVELELSEEIPFTNGRHESLKTFQYEAVMEEKIKPSKVITEAVKSISEEKDADLVKEIEKIKSSINIDGLTGSYNRKFLFEQLERMSNYSLVVIDIDKFKSVNDTYGHPAGDEVLKFLAHFLKSKCRHNDIVVRYGGEEFIIVFPNAEVKDAVKKIDIIREALSRTIIPIPENKTGERELSITFSAGVTQWTANKTIEELIKEADDWLYKAKENGRNQVQPQHNLKKLIYFKPKSSETVVIQQNKKKQKVLPKVVNVFKNTADSIISISSILFNLIKIVFFLGLIIFFIGAFLWVLGTIAGFITADNLVINKLVTFKMFIDSAYVEYLK